MRQLFVAGLLALLPVPVARAQEVTEVDYLAGFGEGHAAVRALTAGLAEAQAARSRAGTLANPRVEFWSERPDANPQVTNWTIAWTPPLDGRYRLGVKAAEAGVAAARDRLDSDRAGLRREARQAFADWSLAGERREVLRRQVDRVAALAALERQRARVGEGSGLAARRLALAEAEARASLGTAEAEVAMAEAVARALRPDLPASALPGAVTLPEPPADLDSSGAPDVGALRRDLEQAGLEARRTGRFLGFPTLQLGWQTIEDDGAGDSGPILAAGWSIPLFDRSQADRLEAEGREAALGAHLTMARARAAGRVDGGLAAYRVLFASAGEARDAAREIDRVIEAATAAFRAGEAGLTDLLETLRSAVAARLREIDARAQALGVHRDLEAVLGRPLPGGTEGEAAIGGDR